MKLLLVGAGGHGSVVADAARRAGHRLTAYVDPGAHPAWLGDTPRIAENDDRAMQRDDLSQLADSFVLGIGGVTPDQLANRLDIHRRYAAKFDQPSPALVHPRASVADLEAIGAGAAVMAGAVVNSNARIGPAAIVNSGAIVEHDAVVEEGAHVAPGAIVLGGAFVGACAMIGAGAVVLPGAKVAARVLVPALTRHGQT